MRWVVIFDTPTGKCTIIWHPDSPTLDWEVVLHRPTFGQNRVTWDYKDSALVGAEAFLEREGVTFTNLTALWLTDGVSP